jgi:small subunit ribosomal protein S1
MRIIETFMENDKSQTPANDNQPEGGVSDDEFRKLVEKSGYKASQVGETVTGTVLSASKAEVRLDIDGVTTGVVRGRELYEEADEYANLKPGDTVEATVIEPENENGEVELSFRRAGAVNHYTFKNKTILKAK